MLNGIHGHPIQRLTQPRHFTAWTAGDFGVETRSSGDGQIGAAEIGGGYNFGAIQTNLSLGRVSGRQETPRNGLTKLDGSFVMIDGIGRIPGTPLFATLSGIYQRGDVDAQRNYLQTGVVNVSRGSTSQANTGGVVRLDWLDAVSPAGIRTSPYAKLTVLYSTLDGFSEKGGGSPAQYHSRSETLVEQTLGVNLTREISRKLTLFGTVEGVHRFQDRAPGVGGLLPGGTAFHFEGEGYRQNWMRFTLGFESPAGPGTLNISLNATSPGEQASRWLAVSYQIHF